jgi:hypothetical protein
MVALVLRALAVPLISLRVSTVRAIARIEALRGRTGDFAALAATIRTRYSLVDSPDGLEHARAVMGLATLSNLSIVRFNGEGLPYFYGYVAYDTNRQQVVGAVVERLW